MSYTNHTPNYNLPQYVGTDKPTFLGDFNNAMETIDTALHNNAENAGEGLAQLQEAQNQLTETQEAQSKLNEEVSNIGGIASTVNQNVQQALTAANDATTAANSAKSQIEPAVTAANNASAAAAEAKTVADQNTVSVNSLNERVTALENSRVDEISGVLEGTVVTSDGNAAATINKPENGNLEKIVFQANKQPGGGIWFVLENKTASADFTAFATYTSTRLFPALNEDIEHDIPENSTAVRIRLYASEGTNNYSMTIPFTVTIS